MLLSQALSVPSSLSFPLFLHLFGFIVIHTYVCVCDYRWIDLFTSSLSLLNTLPYVVNQHGLT